MGLAGNGRKCDDLAFDDNADSVPGMESHSAPEPDETVLSGSSCSLWTVEVDSGHFEMLLQSLQILMVPASYNTHSATLSTRGGRLHPRVVVPQRPISGDAQRIGECR